MPRTLIMPPAPSTPTAVKAEQEFVKNLEEAIVRAAAEANAKLTPDCRFAFHLGEEPDIGENSRQLLADGMINWIGSSVPIVGPTGPFDPQFPVWVFRDRRGQTGERAVQSFDPHHRPIAAAGVRSPSFYGLAAQATGRNTGGAGHVFGRGLGFDAQHERSASPRRSKS